MRSVLEVAVWKDGDTPYVDLVARGECGLTIIAYFSTEGLCFGYGFEGASLETNAGEIVLEYSREPCAGFRIRRPRRRGTDAVKT